MELDTKNTLTVYKKPYPIIDLDIIIYRMLEIKNSFF